MPSCRLKSDVDSILQVACFRYGNSAARILPDFKLVFSIEEHYINGGLGSMAAETIAENNFNCKLVRCGIKSQVDGITGSHQFMLKHYGLSAEKLLERALGELRGQY